MLVHICMYSMDTTSIADAQRVQSSRDCVSLYYFTGTPPRLDGRSIDYSVCTVQEGDDPPVPFSFMNDTVWIKVTSPHCHSLIL
jgi:tRNA U34 5-carboxymethylaminomethyl modifying enzyme MnmG/GidA